MKKAIRVLAALLCAVTILTLFAACGNEKQDEKAESGGENVSTKVETTAEPDPIISGNYMYFGSYPQREVVAKASDSGVHGKAWETENDYIIDESLYSTLKNLSEDKWSTSGDTTVDGNKYRRLKSADATMSSSGDANYYDFGGSGTYHYFKYEPIKWRILENKGNSYLLLSETALDDQRYNSIITNLTWETSTIRSWLNGYGSTANLYGTDYTSANFIDTAFSSYEKAKINVTNVVNKDNSNTGTEGGNDTSDRIFLLSEDEIYGSVAAGYGFATDYNTHDAARRAQSSTYAKAMGAYADCESESLGCCWWWLRSPGSYTGLYTLVRCNGSVYRGGQHANSKSRAVRPAMYVEF